MKKQFQIKHYIYICKNLSLGFVVTSYERCPVVKFFLSFYGLKMMENVVHFSAVYVKTWMRLEGMKHFKSS